LGPGAAERRTRLADPEVFGLLALMLLQQSRAPARFDADGEIVLLEEQDRGERQGV
jgi:RNA polymerase sigma-70 factor (ECF subfamily)